MTRRYTAIRKRSAECAVLAKIEGTWLAVSSIIMFVSGKSIFEGNSFVAVSVLDSILSCRFKGSLV